MKTLRATLIAAALAGALGLASAQGVRPEVGKPLQAASEALRKGNAKEALAKVREADAVPNKTPFEQLTIERMRAAAAQRAGDLPAAIQALEAIYPKAGGAEQGQLAEQLASAYAQQRNNAKATEWLNKAVQAGNNGPSIQQLKRYLESASGDYAAVARDAGASVAAAEQAGRVPEEADLLRLADAQLRTGNTAGHLATLEKLVLSYPKKEYWTAYLGRLQRKPGFSDRFALDVMRLRLASGTLTKADDYMEMTQLALQAGVTAEARNVVEAGFKAGILGTGPDAARHIRLRDLAIKQDTEAKGLLPKQAADAESFAEGDALVKVGFAYAAQGDMEKGIDLIKKGIAKGGLKYPQDARLRLGMAEMMSPGTKAAGIQALRGVRGTDGVADIARLWVAVKG
jgi:tetratricopeptide (TPR) repeat protein